MINSLKKLKRKIYSVYFFLYNKFQFKINNVDIANDFNINGKIFIRNKGSIEIGEKFFANSGKNFNPIGGDSILRLICFDNGKLAIGNNLGISNSTIVCCSHIEIGNNVRIGGGCKIWDTDFHSLDPVIRTSHGDNKSKSSPITIKDYAFLGGSCIILKGVTIGYKSIVAAGSVVTKNVPDEEIWGGNPAKFIRKI